MPIDAPYQTQRPVVSPLKKRLPKPVMSPEYERGRIAADARDAYHARNAGQPVSPTAEAFYQNAVSPLRKAMQDPRNAMGSQVGVIGPAPRIPESEMPAPTRPYRQVPGQLPGVISVPGGGVGGSGWRIPGHNAFSDGYQAQPTAGEKWAARNAGAYANKPPRVSAANATDPIRGANQRPTTNDPLSVALTRMRSGMSLNAEEKKLVGAMGPESLSAMMEGSPAATKAAAKENVRQAGIERGLVNRASKNYDKLTRPRTLGISGATGGIVSRPGMDPRLAGAMTLGGSQGGSPLKYALAGLISGETAADYNRVEALAKEGADKRAADTAESALNRAADTAESALNRAAKTADAAAGYAAADTRSKNLISADDMRAEKELRQQQQNFDAQYKQAELRGSSELELKKLELQQQRQMAEMADKLTPDKIKAAGIGAGKPATDILEDVELLSPTNNAGPQGAQPGSLSASMKRGRDKAKIQAMGTHEEKIQYLAQKGYSKEDADSIINEASGGTTFFGGPASIDYPDRSPAGLLGPFGLQAGPLDWMPTSKRSKYRQLWKTYGTKP